ncbi:TetR/AcrR family transcriptional regulator [Actinokineospora bangkokensis]|uniref:TetR family transcriptional regulator n=1 Tax=Actinokineospora bangkokensis TaxID=1193682 RepID=A0A1Q9LP01_9PSEU|nr:TetR/AcrR family transcriptional regulator [Actinokineospora bangkokensis]OLR93733.1 TetR family transcriptional regulator [Actinokineospora bangkokensis]
MPRSDAEHNRAHLLSVASAALGESPEVTLSAIAKRAGVGQGTLYRHFPTRESLLLAVYRQDVEALIGAAGPLLAEHPPVEALRRWFARLAAYGRVKHGVSMAVEAATRADLSHEYYDRTTAAITLLLDAGKESGELRRDVTADEVLLLVGFLWRAHTVDTAHPLEIVLDGLRAQGGRALQQ